MKTAGDNEGQLSAGRRVAALSEALFGRVAGHRVARQVAQLLDEVRPRLPGHDGPPQPLTQDDVLLITYGDMVQAAGQAPLRTLAEFCEARLTGVVSGIHILPHFPFTSDDGFSVTDYFAVNPELGDWPDVARLGQSFELMFDAVFNHMSAQSEWFRKFLEDTPGFRDFFVTVIGDPDLSQVVRPRALPLLTEFPAIDGPRNVWTTFSADQVDLNFKNPEVLLATLRALLFYVEQGARFIRLDAIAYLWKEIGTPCIHLPQTHAVIQLWRAVLDDVAPAVQLITETNVPHTDNISYFGDGTNEAQQVYNFALPPLVLHALLRGDAGHLTRWAATLQAPSHQTTFFNFLASHDGIGLNPARGILPAPEIALLVERCLAHGGFVNYKHNADGSRSPYEMNIVYFDALNDPTAGDLLATQVNRFMVAQAIMLALPGVPGIYFHSLFGSRNDREAALSSGINRRINRQKLRLAELEGQLGQPHSLRSWVFDRFRALLAARRSHPGFDPHAAHRVLGGDARVFAVLRIAAPEVGWVLCVHNVTRERVVLRFATMARDSIGGWTEMLGRRTHAVGADGVISITLEPYEVNWLTAPGPEPAEFIAET